MRISDWSSDVCSSDLREIDFLTVGGASTRNVDAAAADIILGPGAALTIGFGHGVRDIFLVDLFLGDAGFGGAGRRELLGHLILDDGRGAGHVEPDQLHLGIPVDGLVLDYARRRVSLPASTPTRAGKEVVVL